MPRGSSDASGELVADARDLVIVAASILSAVVAALVAFRGIWNRDSLEAVASHPGSFLGAGLVFVAGAAVHELVHLLAWKAAGGMSWRDLSVRRSPRKLGLVAAVRVPASARTYRIGLAAPVLLVGIAPIVTGLATGLGLLLLWGLVFLFESFSDLTILLVTRHVPPETPVLEHRERLGCWVVRDPGAV